jgi:hypothetical protein
VKESFGDKLSHFLKLTKDDVRVGAYFVREPAYDNLKAALEAQGVSLKDVVKADGLVVVHQEDVPFKGFIQLNDDVAVAVDQSFKEFEDESVIKAYSDGVQATGFLPGVSKASESLAQVVWNLLNTSDDSISKDERIAKVDSMLVSFRKYMSTLLKSLPDQVLKVEAATRGITTEDSEMRNRTAPLKEAVAGDLDGIDLSKEEVTKTDEEAADKKAAAPSDETDVTKGCGPKGKDAEVMDEEEDEDEEEMTVEKTDLSKVLEAVAGLTAAVESLAKTQKDQFESLSARIEKTETVAKSAEQVAKTAEVRAKNTVVVNKSDDVDFTYANLGGTNRDTRKVVKSEGDLWDGLLEDLGTFRGNR